MFSQKKIGMLLAEVLGTATLSLVVLSVMNSPIGINYFTAAAAGTSLAITVLAVGRLSGAHINPAVTFGLWSIKKIETATAIMYVAAQFLGGVVAWRLYEFLTARAVSNIAGKDFKVETLVAEVVGTFIFTFGIAAAVFQGYKGLRSALLIGASLFLGAVVASSASNGVLNPAVAVGIQSVGRAYMVGPLLGALFGMNLYALFFVDQPAVAKAKVTVKKKK